MIRILTKVAYRFTNPFREGSLSKPKPNETPEEATQRVARDSAVALSNSSTISKHKEHHCEVQPGVPTDCPDWIKADDLFTWGVSDGNIEELVLRPQAEAVKAATDDDDAENAAADDSGNMGDSEEEVLQPGGPVRRRRVAGPGKGNSRVQGKDV